MIPKIVAIDPGGHTGIAAFDGERMVIDTLDLPPTPGNPGARLTDALNQLNAIMALIKPELVATEDTSFAARSAAQRTASLHLNAMTHCSAYSHGAPVLVVPPQTWKKFALGFGGMNKDDVAAAVQAHGLLCGTQDEADACGILCGALVKHRDFDPDAVWQHLAAVPQERLQPDGNGGYKTAAIRRASTASTGTTGTTGTTEKEAV